MGTMKHYKIEVLENIQTAFRLGNLLIETDSS